MKKIILLSIFIIASLWVSTTYAEWDETNKTSTKIKVQVTEKMPWMTGCYQTKAWASATWSLKSTQVANWETYTCEIEPGFASVQLMLSGIIKYFTFIAGIAGVLFLVINGIMYSMWGMDASMKDEAKKRIIKTLVWLMLLFSSGIILNIIAPWIYT